MKYFWGVDCGSTEIKVAVLDSAGQLVHLQKRRTLFPLAKHLQEALMVQAGVVPGSPVGSTRDVAPAAPWPAGFSPLDSNLQVTPEHFLVGTGYGRNHMEFVQDRVTEIKAHHLGVRLQNTLPQSYTVIDIGGQDSKVLLVEKGELQNFLINRKCAAGTGAYIEELAHRLGLKMDALEGLEKGHDKLLSLNSFCTVFAGQEVIKVLMEGERVENLIHALYQSVVKRVCEMTPITHDTLVFSGGVLEHHPAIRRIFQERFPQRKLVLSPHAQFCGAIGAAQYGRLTQTTK